MIRHIQQLELPFVDVQPITAVYSPPEATITERFERFHEANPHVYDALRDMALWLKGQGKRAGIKLLFEQLRWLALIQTDGEPYKLNNDFTAHYARLLMADEPQLDGFFQIRERRTA